MSIAALQERLTALQETTTQLRELIDRLAHLDFQPGSVPQGTDEESSVSGELSEEIGQLLRNGLDEQELLQEEVKFARPEGVEKTGLRESVDRLASELASCRGNFRKARLAARESLARAQKLERQLIIQSYSLPVSEPDVLQTEEAPAPIHRPQRYYQEHQQSHLSENEQRTVGAGNDVTNALRRTHDLIATELFRSEYAHQTLTESSAALKQLNESYSSLDSMLASSRDLLGTLLRSQKSDTWYLQTSMYMLMVTGAWLLFRRLLYGPMWWLVWLPLRVLFGVGSKAGSAVMQRGAGESGKVGGVGEDGKVSVEGLPKEDLPTVQVGGKMDSGSKDDSDSMIEKVAKVVEEAGELGNLGGEGDVDAEDQPRNPKKRMWEEPEVKSETGSEGIRDEL
ncbi:Sec20 domain-containing protein [Pochonia chlamydosporia 170]|uniref:Sec20 domain-containing protein n=1 Tax=Pochonia chlamydosporia 170 TaxID=1380566 RepID=A0A179G4Y2_METCM|nr:Sec20 domain-containing protein [Pochonia chlamydosporia 170]OAQ72403.1 Sec20 domain-containing protein [Pochonia chlamydosporia 170]